MGGERASISSDQRISDEQSERQVIAEKIGSTVRLLELLGLEYAVTPPKNERKRGNRGRPESCT
jgi:hypothetical protein